MAGDPAQQEEENSGIGVGISSTERRTYIHES